MTFKEFHNGLRVLLNIDRPDIPVSLTDDEWISFRDAPHMFFIKCGDVKARAIWSAAQKRMKPDPFKMQLMGALEPFADVADDAGLVDHPDSYAPRPSRGRPNMGDFRRAAAAIAAAKGE